MFGWFKRLPRKILELEATFRDPNDPGLHGDLDFDAYDDGRWRFELELDHGDARLADDGPIEIHVDGQRVDAVAPGDRRTVLRRASDVDALAFTPAHGQLVELVQNGRTRLAGRFEYD